MNALQPAQVSDWPTLLGLIQFISQLEIYYILITWVRDFNFFTIQKILHHTK